MSVTYRGDADYAAVLAYYRRELAALGCRVERVAGHDTDLLGTFTRDIPCAGTQTAAGSFTPTP